jgi:hypothetical protein
MKAFCTICGTETNPITTFCTGCLGGVDPDVTRRWPVRPDRLHARSHLGDPTASSARHSLANKGSCPWRVFAPLLVIKMERLL